MIPFNKITVTSKEEDNMINSIRNFSICGNGYYTQKCEEFLRKYLQISSVLLTSSCTHSLEMSAILMDIKTGDEIIMPSYTFVSTANAFVIRGAKIVFVDIRPDTMNIDETKIEEAITSRTKAIVPVHYAGVACEMDTIMNIAKKYELYVVEDAAQALGSSYKGRLLGSIGHMSTFSFHETKNITSAGEGGALIVNDAKFRERAEVLREKGTNRSQFFRGEIDKYSWIDIGSSYLMSDVSAAFLLGQLERIDEINRKREDLWNLYYKELKNLEIEKKIILPTIPNYVKQNAHLFYFKVKNKETRIKIINFLKENNISSLFHYVPLHSSVAGGKFGIFNGTDSYTTNESEVLIRLPLFFDLDSSNVKTITNKIYDFFRGIN